jgi:hypothetical protein
MNDDQVFMFSRDGFTELLHRPRCGGMRRQIDVKETSAVMLNHLKEVYHT